MKTVTWIFGTQVIDAGLANLVIGDKLGYYAEEGIKFEWVNSGGALAQFQGVVTGNADISYVVQDPLLQAVAKGEKPDAIYVYNIVAQPVFNGIVLENSPINSWKDVQGKTIGYPSQGSATLGFAKIAMRESGLDPESANFQAVGVGAQAAAAIRSGQVDVYVTHDYAIAGLENLGMKFKQLPNVGMLNNLFGSGFMVRNSMVRDNPDLVVGVTRAAVKGTIFMMENPRAAVQIFFQMFPEAKPAGLSDQDALEQTIRVVNARTPKFGLHGPRERWGLYEEQGWKTFVQYLGVQDQISDVKQFYTNDLVPKINDFDPDKIRQQAKDWKPS